MNNRVDFYILKENNYLACLPFVCQLVAKAYTKHPHILLEIESTTLSKTLDDKLWTFKHSSFIPHHIVSQQSLMISTIDTDRPSLLINIKLPEKPPEIQQQRLLQLVLNTDKHLQCARQHYKHYQQLGAEVKTHDLRG